MNNNIERHCIMDEKSFSNFYETYKKFVFKIAFNITRCPNLARDAKQDVFLSLWINRHKLSLVGNVKCYLFICTRNASLGILVKLKKERNIDLKEEECAFWKKVEGKMMYQTVREEVVEKFPSRLKMVYQLAVEKGMNFKEIAEAMNITLSTVKNQRITAFNRVYSFLEAVV